MTEKNENTVTPKRGRKSDGKVAVTIRVPAEVAEKFEDARWSRRVEKVGDLYAEAAIAYLPQLEA